MTDGSLSKESHDPDARMFDATLQVIRLFSATIAVYAQWRTRDFLIEPPLCNRPTVSSAPCRPFRPTRRKSGSRSGSGSGCRQEGQTRVSGQPVGATRDGERTGGGASGSKCFGVEPSVPLFLYKLRAKYAYVHVYVEVSLDIGCAHGEREAIL